MIARLVVLAALAAAWSVRAEEAPRFVAARFDAKARVVRFDAPVEVDWQAAARAHFTTFDFERLTDADLAYLRGKIWEISGNAEERFSFAPPAVQRTVSYQLITAQGIAPLRVAAFEGTIRFAFDQGTPPVFGGVSFFGEAVSQTGAAGGGFAMVMPGAVTPERIADATADIAREADGVRLIYRDGATRVSILLTTKWHDAFETAYGFRVGARRYLFVDWPADEQGFGGYCADGFSLYEVGTTLNEVAASAYNCDV